MNVRRAIELLQQLPPDAEVMIDAPFACAKATVIAETQNLCIPVRALRSGIFFYPHPPGAEWACFMGTDVWGMDQGDRDVMAERPIEEQAASQHVGNIGDVVVVLTDDGKRTEVVYVIEATTGDEVFQRAAGEIVKHVSPVRWRPPTVEELLAFRRVRRGF